MPKQRLRAEQPGSKPIDIPESVPNPATAPRRERIPRVTPAPAPAPVRVPEKVSA